MPPPTAFFNVAGPAALLLRRHMALYGTTEEQMAAIAVTFRQHARLNPLAVMQEPLTKEDYLASRYIVASLHLYDMCLHHRRGRLPHRHLRRTRPRPAQAPRLSLGHGGATRRWATSPSTTR